MITNPFRGQRGYLVWALAGIVLITTVACSVTVAPTTPIPVPTSVSITISPEATPTPTSPLPPAGAPTAATEVKVSLTEWRVDLDKSDVTAGPVRFVIKNDGTTSHAFEIEGQGIDQRTNNLNPGESATMDVQLMAGTYEAYCPVDGHRDEGMTSTLTVK